MKGSIATLWTLQDVAAETQDDIAPASVIPFEQLSLARFGVKHGARIFGFIQLTMRRIDPNLSKQIRHAERARLVRNDGHDPRAERLVLQKIAEEPDGGHRRGHLFALGPKSEFRVSLERRHRYTLSAPAPRGQITTKGIAPRAKIAKLRPVIAGWTGSRRPAI